MPLQEVVDVVTANNTAIRVKLQGLPDRMALELSGVDNPVDMRERLEEVMNEALEQLGEQFERENDDKNDDNLEEHDDKH